MALMIPVRGFTPQIGKDCFLAPNASIIGDVVMGDECSVWFGTVLRGDVNSIRIGNRVNIQDGSVLHTLYQKSTILMNLAGAPPHSSPGPIFVRESTTAPAATMAPSPTSALSMTTAPMPLSA